MQEFSKFIHTCSFLLGNDENECQNSCDECQNDTQDRDDCNTHNKNLLKVLFSVYHCQKRLSSFVEKRNGFFNMKKEKECRNFVFF